MKTRPFRATGMFAAALLVLALCRPLPAAAVSTVTVSGAGEGAFLVEGTNIENAAALEITISYDIATLANPRVVAGPLIAGAMTATNPNVPGTVRMVIIRLTPVHGSGVIATLTFDCKGASSGRILSLRARLANINGASIPVIAQVNNPAGTPTPALNDPQNEEAASVAKTSGQAAATTTATPAAIAPTIIIAGQTGTAVETRTPPDTQGTKQTGDQPVPPETGSEPREEPAIKEQKTDEPDSSGTVLARAADPARRVYKQKSILDRFQEYKGERTPEAFISLFEQEGMAWCRQDPHVALSDGKTAVRVTLISTPDNAIPSNVAVMGARLISVKKDPDNTNTWVVELVPIKGEYRASIAVSQGEVMMVYPLTIAPKVAADRSRSGMVTKADFDRYFNKQGTASFARLPGGKQDYLDDYIITANYLAASRTAKAGKPD